jgi:hypothetical protein
VTQSAGSLARIAGPVFAGSLYHETHPHWAYVACAAMAFLTFGVVLAKLIPSLRKHTNASAGSAHA